ncbi:hypothetical protein [Planktothrix rubescens]|uniref:hypothetical protein n=1 Tax=Planktothrix rubescens TaxID=59512 RepID=UPI00041B3FBE|nr:hypothetical protein [Planktothrix rubescens]
MGTTNKGDPFAFPMPDGSVAILRSITQQGNINGILDHWKLFTNRFYDELYLGGGDGKLKRFSF